MSNGRPFSTRLAMLAGRATLRILRIAGRAATTLPGRIALTIDPALLVRLTTGRRVFLVTGTNGKTTTVRILRALLEQQGLLVTTNISGANLDSGLATTLIEAEPTVRAAKRQGKDCAFVFEIDEAFFGKIADSLNPEVAVVTNFFRDQLDRFGELRTTRDFIDRGLSKVSAKAVLCADDSLCASLGRARADRARYFAMSDEMLTDLPVRSSDEAAYCLYCGGRYQYLGRTYGHLGRFLCPECGFKHPDADLSVRILEPEKTTTGQGQRLLFSGKDGFEASAFLPIPGRHNAYNAAAAVLAMQAAGFDLASVIPGLSAASPAFGRMERFKADGKDVCLLLVKNPVGMDRALEFVTGAPDLGGAYLLLNSEDPDGRDVSWIWDVDFESHPLPSPVHISGRRCHDLALRLYYAGVPRASLVASPDDTALFDAALEACPEGKCLYVLPNYTAMLKLRATLAQRYGLRAFWEQGA